MPCLGWALQRHCSPGAVLVEGLEDVRPPTSLPEEVPPEARPRMPHGQEVQNLRCRLGLQSQLQLDELVGVRLVQLATWT